MHKISLTSPGRTFLTCSSLFGNDANVICWRWHSGVGLNVGCCRHSVYTFLVFLVYQFLVSIICLMLIVVYMAKAFISSCFLDSFTMMMIRHYLGVECVGILDERNHNRIIDLVIRSTVRKGRIEHDRVTTFHRNGYTQGWKDKVEKNLFLISIH